MCFRIITNWVSSYIDRNGCIPTCNIICELKLTIMILWLYLYCYLSPIEQLRFDYRKTNYSRLCLPPLVASRN